MGSDPAVGAEPGKAAPGSVQAQVLLVQPAGQRAPKPQEPPGCGQPALQEHAGTPGGLLRVLLPRPGKKRPEDTFFTLRSLDLVSWISSSAGLQSRRGACEEGGSVPVRRKRQEGAAVVSEGSGRTEETLQGRPVVPGNPGN